CEETATNSSRPRFTPVTLFPLGSKWEEASGRPRQREATAARLAHRWDADRGPPCAGRATGSERRRSARSVLGWPPPPHVRRAARPPAAPASRRRSPARYDVGSAPR